MNFEHLGVMLDCSRNAVMNTRTAKRYIDILEKLGYNTLMLYTEDTYEVDNQPYFGYLRGKYSKSELKELDRYAIAHNIELIPCIQTLAHLNGLVRWNEYKPYTDIHDILLAGDERTYRLIDDMFATLEECFTSRTVHLGMDEAQHIGLGKYLNEHGFKDRFEIMTNHVSRVCEIAKKHGFSPMMWSDMFFHLASGGYYNENAVLDRSVVEKIPKNLTLVYWDYYSTEKEHYDNMIASHRQFHNDIWYAGGLWTWHGVSPANGHAINTVSASIPSMIGNKVKNIFFTLWGDDGGECSKFSALPSLFFAAQKAHGIDDIAEIKRNFYDVFKISFDDFMLLDLPNVTTDKPDNNNNPEKYMFYNDCFSGIFDCTVPDGFSPKYDECAKKLNKLENDPNFGYLFSEMARLCEFMQIKYTLGVRTRKAYRENNKAELLKIIDDYKTAESRLDKFYLAFKKAWFCDNKPYGFEIQDIRIGGLKQRLISCADRLTQYVNGKIEKIDELDEDILPEFDKSYHIFNNWGKNVTANVISHQYFG